VAIDHSLLRPTDIMVGRADPSKASKVLGWSSTFDVDGVVSHMCDAASVEGKK